jgi:hypothetical protein
MFQARVAQNEDHASPGESITALTDATAYDAKTICWFRLEDTEKEPCGGTPSRADELAMAAGPDPQWGGEVELRDPYPTSCDFDGLLYGYAIPAGRAEDCPSTLPPEANPRDLVAEFVGQDLYPARLACSYQTTYSTWCGGCGSGGLPLE